LDTLIVTYTYLLTTTREGVDCVSVTADPRLTNIKHHIISIYYTHYYNIQLHVLAGT